MNIKNIVKNILIYFGVLSPARLEKLKNNLGIRSPSKTVTSIGSKWIYHFNLGIMKAKINLVDYKNHKFILYEISAPKYKGISEIEEFKREIEERK